MNSINLLDELLSGLQLQKEYIGLELAEKLTHLLAVTSLALALLITGTTLLYFWGGPLASLAFLVISLLITSSIAFYRKQSLAHIKKEKKAAILASQHSFKSHFKEMTTPPDTALQLCQTIRTITDIIQEVKKLFKEKG